MLHQASRAFVVGNLSRSTRWNAHPMTPVAIHGSRPFVGKLVKSLFKSPTTKTIVDDAVKAAEAAAMKKIASSAGKIPALGLATKLGSKLSDPETREALASTLEAVSAKLAQTAKESTQKAGELKKESGKKVEELKKQHGGLVHDSVQGVKESVLGVKESVHEVYEKAQRTQRRLHRLKQAVMLVLALCLISYIARPFSPILVELLKSKEKGHEAQEAASARRK